MTVHRRIIPALAAIALGVTPPVARAADPPTYTIDPHATDAAIVDTTPTRGQHLVWLGPEARRAGKLLVFLPTGGPTNVPSEFTELGTAASRLGYHTIILAYRNEAPIMAAPTASPPGCGNGAEPQDAPPNCAIDIRTEILDGRDTSAVVSVNRANSIENRLDKLLVYLDATHRADGWGQFLDSSGAEPDWSKTVIAGSSLGAGEAVIIAARHDVSRVALLHGWTDAKHGWVTLGATPSSHYFTLIHARDGFFARTCYAYVALGLAQTCPLPGFTIPPATVDPANPLFVENRKPPYGQLHVFDLEPGSFAGTGDWYHQSTSRDGWIAREPDNTPAHALLSAWRSVLGDPLATASGGATGTVAATLSLALGSPAAFGGFTPGADRSYDASTTATVVSTAGDGVLAVGDPAAAAPGRLVNGAFSLTEPLQAKASSAAGTGGVLAPLGAAPLPLLAYAGPVSNDAVAIAFRQHIGPTQALRTGTYTKTLTFTLSTTAP